VLAMPITSTLINAYLSSQLQQVILLALAIVVLVIRPEGLLSGKAAAGRL